MNGVAGTFAAILCLSVSIPLSAAEPDGGYSIADADAYRRGFTIDNWDDGGPLTRYVFLHMSEFWAHSLIDRAGEIRPLERALRDDLDKAIVRTAAGEQPLEDYVEDERVDAMIVLQENRIVFEAYPRMRPDDKHLWMSVSKPVAATLIGILADRELIDEAEPVTAYLPELDAGGWGEVSVRDVLDMASGIDCRQSIAGAYTDPATCYYQFEAALGWLPPTDATSKDVHAWVAALPLARPPGEAFEYTSVNTFVLRWIVERVAGKPYADVVSEEIWQRLGAESDALLVAPRHGIPVAASGLSSTLRDMARFGLLFTPGGRRGAVPVVSERLLDEILENGRPELLNAARGDSQPVSIAGDTVLANSYQWDVVMADGDLYKGGYGGQGLYVSPARDLVIAFFGTLDADGNSNELREVSRQLATSGLFE